MRHKTLFAMSPHGFLPLRVSGAQEEKKNHHERDALACVNELFNEKRYDMCWHILCFEWRTIFGLVWVVMSLARVCAKYAKTVFFCDCSTFWRQLNVILLERAKKNVLDQSFLLFFQSEQKQSIKHRNSLLHWTLVHIPSFACAGGTVVLFFTIFLLVVLAQSRVLIKSRRPSIKAEMYHGTSISNTLQVRSTGSLLSKHQNDKTGHPKKEKKAFLRFMGLE
jgi:hypothetical protein